MRLVGENLESERGGERLFSGLGFIVQAGEALAVTGPNGAGKSTLLRIIAGLLAPATGSVRIEGGAAELAGPGAASHYLGHLNAMKPVLTLHENLRFWQSFDDTGNGAGKNSIAQALERVGLGEIGHLPFGYLSTGQRRRASIAKLLVSDRPLWLLDEPTAGLDKASDMQFSGLMRAHLSNGGIIVAATHLPLGLERSKELMLGTAS